MICAHQPGSEPIDIPETIPIRLWYPSQHLFRQNPLPRSQFDPGEGSQERRLNGRQLYDWRAVDSEGEVLDILVQPWRDRKAALVDAKTPKEAARHSSHHRDRQARILQLL